MNRVNDDMKMYKNDKVKVHNCELSYYISHKLINEHR